MIKLRQLLNEETFTATNKASGKTSVFKSKDSRDNAIKAGTHNPIKDKGDSKSKGSETPKVNIFNKPSKSNDGRSEKIKSKEELYSKFDSLQNNPDALLKFMNTEILPNYDHRTKTSIDYVRGEIENLKNPKASTSKKNKSKENIKQILTNVINYNLEKVAEKRAVSKGWPDRDEYLANNNSASNKKANLSNMKSKDELYSAIDSLTGEKFEEYVLKEVVPYLDNSILLNTLFINANSINKGDKTYEPFLKKMVKNEIESTINPKDTSTKKSKKALSSDKQINFGDFESLDGINYSTDVSDLIDSNEKIFSKEDINSLYSLQSNLEQAEQDMDDDEADETLDSIHGILKKYMTETKSRILLSKLLNEETFTATNKASGKTSVFKSKDSRDAAIKAGTHNPIKDKGDSNSKGSETPKVNIFDNPSKSKPKKSNKSISQSDIDDNLGNSVEFDDYLDNNEDIFSKDDFNELKSLNSNWQQLEADSVEAEMDDDYELMDEIDTDINNIVGDITNVLDKYLDKSKKTPKSSTTTPASLGVDKVVYNTRTKSVGIVRMADERGETKTDADGNVNTSELEPYNPTKYPHQKDAKVAPSTQKEVDARGLWNPFSTDNDEPTTKPEPRERKGVPAVNKAVRQQAQKLGITPEKLGKDEYLKKMAQAAVSALTDSNFHPEARQLVADLEGKPEMAEKPEYPSMKDPKYKEKMAILNAKYDSVYSSPDKDADELGTSASQSAEWSGDTAIDAIAFDLRMNGFHKMADKIQSVIKEGKVSRTSLTRIMNESASKEAVGISVFTGTRADAVDTFINKNELDAMKLYKSIKSSNLKGRMDFVTALVGKEGNKYQQAIIKAFRK